MSDTIISVEGLGKKYVLSHQGGERGYTRFSERLEGWIKKPFAALARGSGVKRLRGQGSLDGGSPSSISHLPSTASKEEFWALKDVSFEVKRGEVVGIIGRNGAGKSTLLKILSRITEPSEGRVTLRGRVASLLEVGTGFHPELTGRENIFLNGAILGMTKAEIKKKFDEIVAFAEVERFLDTPVKRYSSGMYVRLAFAVAAHLEPEILVVDEVLAVGDAEFQKKCLGKMKDVASGGRTVLFVSHNMDAVSALCNKGIYLRNGMVQKTGQTEEIISDYLSYKGSGKGHFIRPNELRPTSEWRIVEAYLSQNGKKTDTLTQSMPIILHLSFEGSKQQKISFEYILRDEKGKPIGFCPLGLGYAEEHNLNPGKFVYLHDIHLPLLASGFYSLDLILAESGKRFLDNIEKALSFSIESTYNPQTSWSFRQEMGQGSILLPKGKGELTKGKGYES